MRNDAGAIQGRTGAAGLHARGSLRHGGFELRDRQGFRGRAAGQRQLDRRTAGDAGVSGR